jgi:hypothetical protein
MSTEHVTDQLSAFLDGEADDPEAVAAHLRRCAACHNRYLELRAMSLTLHALPAPDVTPAFATRVMAQVHEQAPPRRWPVPVAAWAGAMAVVVLVVVVAGYVFKAPTPQATPTMTLAQMEKQLWAELERRAETEEIEAALGTNDTGYLSNDDLLATLGAEPWFDELVEEVYATAESADLLRSFDTTEVEEFNSLVVSTIGKG